MTTITAAAQLAVNGSNGTLTGSNFNTTPSYSGTFIPALWSAKLNAKFYAVSTFADICNRNWEGDVKEMGDKVIINNIPTLSISTYQAGANLTYQAPTPNTIEMNVDQARYYGFSLNDVLDYQAKPDLMDMFTNDATQQMRVVIDSTCLYNTLLSTPVGVEDGVVAANKGATAGRKSLSYNLGTDAAPVDLSATVDTTLNLILAMASVLDEQNIPDDGRWLLIDPATRLRLMNTKLAQAYLTGDSTSMIRNGLIGTIDRFKVYVTNQLPTAPAGTATPWVSGDGSENSVTSTGTVLKRRLLSAGHSSAIAFASQLVKTEQLRNPTDFGDLVRGLQVFGRKVVKGTGLTTAIVQN